MESNIASREAGDILDLGEVLLISSDGGTTVGEPTLENAQVVASIVEQSRGKKILVFKYKNKIRYRKLRGHRQHHTDLRVEEIVGPDGFSWKHEKKDPPIKDEQVEVDEVEDEVAAEDEETSAEADAAGVDDAGADDRPPPRSRPATPSRSTLFYETVPLCLHDDARLR